MHFVFIHNLYVWKWNGNGMEWNYKSMNKKKVSNEIKKKKIKRRKNNKLAIQLSGGFKSDSLFHYSN